MCASVAMHGRRPRAAALAFLSPAPLAGRAGHAATAAARAPRRPADVARARAGGGGGGGGGGAARLAKEEYVLRMRGTLRDRCVGSDCEFWREMQREARGAAAEEPLLASFMFATVLNHRSLREALAFHLANKLASSAIPATQLMRLFGECMEGEGEEVVKQDMLAVMERDPACTRFIDCLCYFKGFHALQAYRIAHSLWRAGRVAVAYHLQAQVSKELQVDIHPAAVIGPGAFFDHATGVVIGETAVIGKNVSMLHHVTLGGSGKKHGVRHPQIGDGVLIGAGATLLGNVHVGDGAQVGACSLVLEDVAAFATVVGVPAKVVFRGDPKAAKVVPALHMNHERCLQADAAAQPPLNGAGAGVAAGEPENRKSGAAAAGRARRVTTVRREGGSASDEWSEVSGVFADGAPRQPSDRDASFPCDI